jgi:hypothetical protein
MDFRSAAVWVVLMWWSPNTTFPFAEFKAIAKVGEIEPQIRSLFKS